MSSSRAPATVLPCLLGRCIPRSMTAIQNLELDKDFDAEGIEQRGRELWEKTGSTATTPRRALRSTPHLMSPRPTSTSGMQCLTPRPSSSFDIIEGQADLLSDGLRRQRARPSATSRRPRHQQEEDHSGRSGTLFDETRKGAAVYEDLWRALGLSVDSATRRSTTTAEPPHRSRF